MNGKYEFQKIISVYYRRENVWNYRVSLNVFGKNKKKNR